MKLSQLQVARALGVTYATIYAYMALTDHPLPTKETRRGFRTYREFDSEKVKEFAEFHDLEYDLSRANTQK